MHHQVVKGRYVERLYAALSGLWFFCMDLLTRGLHPGLVYAVPSELVRGLHPGLVYAVPSGLRLAKPQALPALIVLLLLCANVAQGFLPVPGVEVEDVMTCVWRDGRYVARQPFHTSMKEEDLLELCRRVVEASNWEVREPCADVVSDLPFGEETFSRMVIGRAGEMLWTATVKGAWESGCRGEFLVAFPARTHAELPEIGLLYPRGEVKMNMRHREGDRERSTLQLSTVESPAVVMPYVTHRLVQAGWQENRDLRAITGAFGDGKNRGYYFHKAGDSLMVVAAAEDAVRWNYFFKMNRTVNKGRQL